MDSSMGDVIFWCKKSARMIHGRFEVRTFVIAMKALTTLLIDTHNMSDVMNVRRTQGEYVMHVYL